MASWAEFEKDRPDLAAAGRALLYQFGVGLGFLATVRLDGGPRVHPMCPVIHDGGMYAFIVPGPKQADLHRDGRYALHSFPCEDNEDAFYCTGRASAEADAGLRQTLAGIFVAERAGSVPVPEPAQHLFRFSVDRGLLTRTTGHGDMAPQHTTWQDPAGPSGPPAPHSHRPPSCRCGPARRRMARQGGRATLGGEAVCPA